MDSKLYDEFGNYIGPELEESEEEVSEGDMTGDEADDAPEGAMEVEQDAPRQVVLHEDKKYYPEAAEVYPEAETLLQEFDTQPITEPIVAPKVVNQIDLLEKSLPETTFEYDFLAGLMEYPSLIRNVSLVGPLHAGKSTIMDCFVHYTHPSIPRKANAKMTRYTDTRQDEQGREVSLKASPMTLVLPDSLEKSYLCNIMDTPGHPCFIDEVTAANRISDGVVIVIDATVGLSMYVETVIDGLVQDDTPMVLCLNCIDRFVTELRLPPGDCYHKIRHTIEDVNAVIQKSAKAHGKTVPLLSPVLENVCFSAGQYGMLFTLESFARLYSATFPNTFDAARFAKNLWGDLYFNEETRKFVDEAPEAEAPRSFVQFIMDPIYKIFAHVIAEEKESLSATLASIGIYLTKKEYMLQSKELLRRVCETFFGGPQALVDVIAKHLPSPGESAKSKCERCYSGDQTGEVAKAVQKCDDKGLLVVNTVKNYHQPSGMAFDCFGRVMSGTICKGDRVKVLGEAFSLDDDEDMAVRVVEALWIFQGRYRIEVSHVPAGNWCLIGGLDTVHKTATIAHANLEHELEIFRPLNFRTEAVIKVACEPLNPSELPKMVDGLRKIEKSFPLAQTKVEESGEHVILGTGELYLDCALHDLRKLYGSIEIKVVDPVVAFCETVVETSALKCFSETPNKKSKLYVVSEPLEKGIAEDLERGNVKLDWGPKKTGEFFVDKYEWDLLAARSIWAFGPDPTVGPNILVDDTLPSEVDKKLLKTCKPSIIQGFQWAAREGPLCEDAMRGVKFKLLDVDLASDPLARGGGQIIPTARRVAYSAFLMATPRLMEPFVFCEIECPADCVSPCYAVLARRRGNIITDCPRPGSPLYTLHAYVPAIESFGLEADIRTHTSGQSFCQSHFDHWDTVPGDPLDKSIVLRPLEPAPLPHLAREFVVKTRRRKGLSEDVTIQKFFDEPMLAELGRQDADIQQYF
jgi:U5 small nuclear ribonucleoprotein component